MGINVAVVGAGLSGLMAAREIARDDHLHVWLLSTGSGASPYVHGLNIVLGNEDSTDCFKEDTLKSGYYLNNPLLVDTLCEESLPMRRVLSELGIELDQKNGEYSLLKPLGSTHPRVASAGNHTGVLIMQALKKELIQKENVTFLDHSRALRIVMENQRPKGLVVCDEKQYTFSFLESNCIVLAGGGFSGIFPFNTNPRDIGGDIIAMAYDAGAALTDLEMIQFEPSVALYPEPVAGKGMITTMFYEGACLRNKNKERFMVDISENAERVNKDVMAKAIYEEIRKGNGTEHGGVYFDATGLGRKKLMESYASYVKRYEAVGIDISKEMFEIAPAPHTSLGGVRIDENGKASVEGIYAAGEATGGIHGANRIGGNAGLETLVFGRRAGFNARKYAKTISGSMKSRIVPYLFSDELNENTTEPCRHPQDIQKEMQQRLADSFYVIRSGMDMMDAKKRFEELLQETGKLHASDNKRKYEILRLKNDITCALLFAISAISRTNSQGCHIRADAVSDDSKYNTIVEKSVGGPRVCKKYKKGETVDEEN